MYCARCGQLLGVADRLCPACGLDLNGSGAIRMTKGEWPGSQARVWTRTHNPRPRSVTPHEPGSRTPVAGPGAVQPSTSPAPGSAPINPANQLTPPRQPAPAAQATAGPTTGEPTAPSTPARVAALVEPELDLSTVDLSQFDLDEDLTTPIQQVSQALEERHARRNRMALTVLSIAVLAALIPLSIVVYNLLNLPGAGAATPSPKPTKAVSTPAKASTKPSTGSSTKPTKAPSSQASSAPPPFPKGTRECSQEVAASNNTSCEFATNVAEHVDRKRTGSWQISAHSPVTNRDYTMNCSRAEFIVCSGGNAAVVYVRPS